MATLHARAGQAPEQSKPPPPPPPPPPYKSGVVPVAKEAPPTLARDPLLQEHWETIARLSGGKIVYVHENAQHAPKSHLAPSFAETALVIRLLLACVSVLADALLLLTSANAGVSDDTPHGRCQEAISNMAKGMLLLNTLVDVVALLTAGPKIGRIWNAMKAGSSTAITSERAGFFAIWRLLLLYGVVWAAVCLALCARTSVSSAACDGDDEVWRMWPFTAIVTLTILSVFVLLWASFWAVLRVVLPATSRTIIADVRAA